MNEEELFPLDKVDTSTRSALMRELEKERARSRRMLDQLKAVALFFAKRPDVFDDIKRTIKEFEG